MWAWWTTRGLAGVLLAWPLMAGAAEPAASAAELKAAYLLRFASFVEWPAAAFSAPVLVLAVAGAPEVLGALQQMPQRQIDGRELQARAARPGEPLDGVHMLFVGGPRVYVETWIARVQGRALLLVTDLPEGLPAGSAINLVQVGERLRFEVAPAALEKAQLRASSRLLGAALKVIE